MDQHQTWHCPFQAFRTEHITTYEGKILRKFKVEGIFFFLKKEQAELAWNTDSLLTKWWRWLSHGSLSPFLSLPPASLSLKPREVATVTAVLTVLMRVECTAESPQSFREWTLHISCLGTGHPADKNIQTTERSPRQFELNFYDRSLRLALSGKTPYKPISPVTWSSFLRL